MDSSMLQGSLLISENQFIRRFPAEPGYRCFLLDVPAEKADVVATGLSRQWQDYGFAIEKSTERLAAFTRVENTYLSIFLVLGGLGLILGSAGLALVVMRNLLERRGELAMLRALGFRRRALLKLVFLEHWGLLLAGVISGVVCALIAIGPALHGRAGRLPVLSMGTMVAAIVLCGGIWIGIATRMCLKGAILENLRHE
jgi:ABC-type antimicrobial peptide transport system permease subunit